MGWALPEGREGLFWGRAGARVADAEHELAWEGIFSDIKDRGLSTVDLVISDGHTGIQ